MVLVVMLNFTGSGGIFRPELQPGFFGSLHSFWNGAGFVEGVRSHVYFGWYALGRHVLVLALWFVVGLVMMWRAGLAGLAESGRRKAASGTAPTGTAPAGPGTVAGFAGTEGTRGRMSGPVPRSGRTRTRSWRRNWGKPSMSDRAAPDRTAPDRAGANRATSDRECWRIHRPTGGFHRVVHRGRRASADSGSVGAVDL